MNSITSKEVIGLLEEALAVPGGLAGVRAVLRAVEQTADEEMFDALVTNDVLAQRLAGIGQTWRATRSQEALDSMDFVINITQKLIKAFSSNYRVASGPRGQRLGELFDVLCGRDETLRTAAFAWYAGSGGIMPSSAMTLSANILIDPEILERHAVSASRYAKSFDPDARMTVGGLAAYAGISSLTVLKKERLKNSSNHLIQEPLPAVVGVNGEVLADVFQACLMNAMKNFSSTNYPSIPAHVQLIDLFLRHFDPATPAVQRSCAEIVEDGFLNRPGREMLLYAKFAEFARFDGDSPVFKNVATLYGNFSTRGEPKVLPFKGNLMHRMAIQGEDLDCLRSAVEKMAEDHRFDRLCNVDRRSGVTPQSPLCFCLGNNYQSMVAESLLKKGWGLDAHDGVALSAAKDSSCHDDPNDPVPGMLRSCLAHLEIADSQKIFSSIKPL